VWQVAFDPATDALGHEQANPRPSVIVNSDFYRKLPNKLALVVPLTSTDRGLIWQPRLSIRTRDGQPSVALVEQIRAVSYERLRHRVSGLRLSADDIDSITFVLRQMIAWDGSRP
jgi:mRNA interferase MazF